MNQVLRDKKAILIFVLPGFILYTIFVILPIIWSGVYSLYEGTAGMKSWSFAGLANYARLFKDKNFMSALSVNMRYVLMVTLGQVTLGLVMALIFKFWVKKFGAIVRTIVFFPVVLPTVAVAQLFAKIYEIQPHYGLLNSLFSALGLENLVQPWIGQSSTALGSLAAMDIWVAIGFYSIIIYGALLDISNEVIEAAQIDGCKSWQLFWHILRPLLMPILATCLIFSFTGTVKMFESALALTGGGPGRATTSLSMYMYDTAFTYMKTGYGSAIALVIFIICVVGSRIIRMLDRSNLK